MTRTKQKHSQKEDIVDVEANEHEVADIRKKRKRTRRPKVKCAHCGYGTRNTEHMSDHVINFHLRVTVHQCHKCGFSAMSKKLLLEHKREEHPTKHSNMKACLLCPYTVSPIRMKACLLCPYTCGSAFLLSRHQLLCHSKDCPWTCSFCAFVSKTEVVLARHVERNHRFNNCFVCGTCGCRRTSKGLMKVHIIKKHLKSLHSAKKAPRDKHVEIE